MDKSSAIFVGMDVHKDSIDIALAQAGAREEVRHYGSIGGGLAEVDRALRRIVAGGRRCMSCMKRALVATACIAI